MPEKLPRDSTVAFDSSQHDANVDAASWMSLDDHKKRASDKRTTCYPLMVEQQVVDGKLSVRSAWRPYPVSKTEKLGWHFYTGMKPDELRTHDAELRDRGFQLVCTQFSRDSDGSPVYCAVWFRIEKK